MEKELYILGLMITDGYQNKGYYNIELKDEDKNVLEDISKSFEGLLYHRTRNTNFTHNYSCTRLVIKDKSLIELFKKFIPIKEKTTQAYIPEEYFNSPSLWRGILDGDGSYGFRNAAVNPCPFISFVTINENLKESFCKIVQIITGQKVIATRNARDNAYNIGLTSTNAKKFVEWLLSEDTFCIQRKREIMGKIIEWQPTGKQGEVHKRWTEQEDDFVFTHTNQECVEILGRTLSSIKNRRTKLNRERSKNE